MHGKETGGHFYQKRGRGLRRYRPENTDLRCGWCAAAGRALCTVQGYHPSYPDAENPEPL